MSKVIKLQTMLFLENSWSFHIIQLAHQERRLAEIEHRTVSGSCLPIPLILVVVVKSLEGAQIQLEERALLPRAK